MTCQHKWNDWQSADERHDSRFCPLCASVEIRKSEKYLALRTQILNELKSQSPEDRLSRIEALLFDNCIS